MADANTENQFLCDACKESLFTGFIKALNEIKENLNTGNEEPSARNEEREELTAGNEEREELTVGKEEREDRTTGNEEREEPNEFKDEKQIKQNAIAQNEIEKQNAENEVGESANAANGKCVLSCSAILKEKLKDNFFHELCYFVLKIARYIKRCYEISKRGSSDIENESVDLRWTVKRMLQNYVDNYSSEKHLGKYLHIANYENRHKVLYATVYAEILYYCNNKTPGDIIELCALCLFAAYDLQETAGFENAGNCVTNCIMEALLMTDSSWIEKWNEPGDTSSNSPPGNTE